MESYNILRTFKFEILRHEMKMMTLMLFLSVEKLRNCVIFSHLLGKTLAKQKKTSIEVMTTVDFIWTYPGFCCRLPDVRRLF